MPGVEEKVLLVLLQFFLVAIVPPDLKKTHKELDLDPEMLQLYARKVDYDLQHLAINPASGDVFTTGQDKILKRYKQPEGK